MKRLIFLGLVVYSAGLAANAQDRPNILWLVAEDLSPRLGCYGNEFAKTPTLDSLAASGMRFTNAFTVAGVCSPSRTGIISGMFPSTIRGHDHRSGVAAPPYLRAYSEYLMDAGYYCTNHGKNDLNVGFGDRTIWDEKSDDDWRGKKTPLTLSSLQEGAHWKNRPKNTPFFAIFNNFVTHESHHNWSGRREALSDTSEVPVPSVYPSTPKVRHSLGVRYDDINRLDKWVKYRLDELRKAGLTDNTIVFFYSDHGDGLPLHKRWIWDRGVHIPLIISWPGHIEPGTVNDELVSAIDFAPTVLSLAGIPMPDYMQGRIFLSEHKQPEPRYLFFTRDKMDEKVDRIRGVRDRQFKYLKNYLPDIPYSQKVKYGESSPIMQELRRLDSANSLNEVQSIWFVEPKPVEELYDVKNDPSEVNNLAGKTEYEETLLRMRAVHEEWQRQTDDFLLKDKSTWNGARNKPQTGKFVSPAPTITDSVDNGDGTVDIKLTTSEDNATILYALGSGDTARFQVYNGTVSVPAGTKLWAKTGWGASGLLTTVVEGTPVAIQPGMQEAPFPTHQNQSAGLTISVYNLAGQLIEKFLSGPEYTNIDEGIDRHLTANNYRPGLYLVRVGEKRKTRLMVFNR